jgi:hypothetical protein
MKAATETDAEILARNIPPKRPCKAPLHEDCVKMHEDGYCICLFVACVFCDKRHAPNKACPKP